MSDNLHYVGIGASAGGLEAIESFFSNVSETSNMTFIVIQHLSPDYKSLMVELLSKKTVLPVHRAENGIAVKPGNIYLIPPRKLLKIFHGKLILDDYVPSSTLHLPIDVFFKSLAEDQGEKAVGIILSGTGSDGTRGVRAIKAHGGVVFVQKPESAKFDGMPNSALETGLADIVSAPDDMPDKLKHIADKTLSKSVSGSIITDEDNLAKIFSLIREKYNVDFTFYKPSTVFRRIERRMTVNQKLNLKTYADFLEKSPVEVSILYSELLIGVTNFFRDPEVFDEIEQNIMPSIIQNANQQEVRFWIAGCSTGEEPYSLAMIAKECASNLGLKVQIKIFATDIDKNAIYIASNGIYPESIAADVPKKYLTKYFNRKDDRFQIIKSVRELVVFAQHNLIKDPPFTNIDFISCRNLLIYLQPVLQQKVLDFFSFSLKENGTLMLGTSESIGDMTDMFISKSSKLKLYQRKGGSRKYKQSESTYQRKPDVRSAPEYKPFTVPQNIKEERVTQALLDTLVHDKFEFVALVNSSQELIHTIGNTSAYLKIPSGRISNDITKLVSQPLSIPISTGMQKVFKSDENVKYTNIKLEQDSGFIKINLGIKKLRDLKGHEPMALIFVEKDTFAGDNEDSLVYNIGRDTEERIRDLESELQMNKENLQATIEELETANEELQATNEELLASNEELQSTNEELQSVNEELNTVNSEYQMKILELTELTNDMENLLENTKVAFIFLDEHLNIRKYTPEASSIYKLQKSDVGRPISDLTCNLKNTDPLESIRKVHNTSEMIEEEVTGKDGNHLLMRIIPYSIGPNIYSGLIISFVDISSIKQYQSTLDKTTAELDEAKDKYYKLFSEMIYGFADKKLLFDSSGKPCDFMFVAHNEAYKNVLELQNDVVGRKASEVFPELKGELADNCSRYNEILSTGTPAQKKIYVDRIDKWLHITTYKSGDETFASIIEDITEQKKSEIEVRETQNILESVLDSSLRQIMVFESVRNSKLEKIIDFRWVMANKIAAETVGETPESIVGKRLLDITPGNKDSGLFDKYVQVVEKGKELEDDFFYNHDDMSAWFNIKAVKNNDGFAVSFDNITEKKMNSLSRIRIEKIISTTKKLKESGSIEEVLKELAVNAEYSVITLCCTKESKSSNKTIFPSARKLNKQNTDKLCRYMTDKLKTEDGIAVLDANENIDIKEIFEKTGSAQLAGFEAAVSSLQNIICIGVKPGNKITETEAFALSVMLQNFA